MITVQDLKNENVFSFIKNNIRKEFVLKEKNELITNNLKCIAGSTIGVFDNYSALRICRLGFEHKELVINFYLKSNNSSMQQDIYVGAYEGGNGSEVDIRTNCLGVSLTNITTQDIDPIIFNILLKSEFLDAGLDIEVIKNALELYVFILENIK